MRYPPRNPPERGTLSADEITRLLGRLCVDCGVCSPSHAQVARLLPTDANTLTEAVLQQEGFAPGLAAKPLRRQIRALIVDAFAHHARTAARPE